MNLHQLAIMAVSTLAALGAGPVRAQQEQAPYVRIADIEIDPGQIDPYRAAVKEHAEVAVAREPGVLALYAVADKDSPTHVTVFEIYADRDAYNAHLETAHFKKYKSTTQGMVKSLKLRDTIPIALSTKAK